MLGTSTLSQEPTPTSTPTLPPKQIAARRASAAGRLEIGLSLAKYEQMTDVGLSEEIIRKKMGNNGVPPFKISIYSLVYECEK